jgi:hypothetical protein
VSKSRSRSTGASPSAKSTHITTITAPKPAVQRTVRRRVVCAGPPRQLMISTRLAAQRAVSSEYTSGAEALGTPVSRLTATMVGGAAKVKASAVTSSSADTARSSGSRQEPGARLLRTSGTAIAAAGT